MEMRPFALVATSTLDAVRGRVATALADWREAWGLADLRPHVACARAWEAAKTQQAAQWRLRYVEGGKALAFGWTRDMVKHVRQKMFGTDATGVAEVSGLSTIADEAAQEAMEDLMRSLARIASFTDKAAQDAEQCVPEEDLFTYASGAALVTVEFNGHAIQCLFDDACLHAAAPRPLSLRGEPLHPLSVEGALGNITMPLTAEVGRVEIDVGNLLTLAPGDVIRLGTAVDKPIQVLAPHGEPLFHAHLGIREESIAIELVRHDA